jgi:PBP1b-binding outer membrane lipoprotein LpoB
MKKKALVLVLLVLVVVLAGCQTQPQEQKTATPTQVILPPPSSKGPDGPPSVKGPNIPMPNNGIPQAVTETETVRYSLPGTTSEFKQ